MDFKELIKQRRKELNLTLEDVAKACNVTKATVMRWENGNIVNVKKDKIFPLAKILQLDPFSLFDFDTASELLSEHLNRQMLKHPEITLDTVNFPVIGEIAAGFDKIAVEDWDGDLIEIPTSYIKNRNKDDFFVLRIKGDSMYPMYIDGDKVLVLKQNATDYNGQVAVAIYNDDNGTIKKIEQRKNAVYLVPINPQYQPVEIKGTDIERLHILGIPKLLIREIEDE